MLSGVWGSDALYGTPKLKEAWRAQLSGVMSHLEMIPPNLEEKQLKRIAPNRGGVRGNGTAALEVS